VSRVEFARCRTCLLAIVEPVVIVVVVFVVVVVVEMNRVDTQE
jgi:hypothetical protein